jgi:hypothetical protein
LARRNEASVTVLPRDHEQAKHYGEPRFEGSRVVAGALDIAEIALDCDGAGGTMTREVAVLGAFRRFRSARRSCSTWTAMTAAEAPRYLERSTRRPPNREPLQKGRLACDMIKSAIVNG